MRSEIYTCLSKTIDMARVHLLALDAGLKVGLHQHSDDPDIEEKRLALHRLETLYFCLATGDFCRLVKHANEQLKEFEDASKVSDIFVPSGKDLNGHVAHIDLTGVLPPYADPRSIREWQWIEDNASYQHRDNGLGGIWEFVLNLSQEFKDTPESLRPLIDGAKHCKTSYLIFHQRT